MKFKPFFIVSVLFALLISAAPLWAQQNMKEADQLDFAQGLLTRGMYDMAILQYQKFIADFPHSPSLQEAYLALGEGYFLSQDFSKATDAFNQFKQLFPQSDQLPVSVLRLGQIDIQQNKFDDAIKELTSIDAQKQLKGPQLQFFDFYMAQAYAGKMDTASALDYFQKAIGVDGASAYTADAYKEIGKIQSQTGHYTEAVDAYAKSMTLAGDDSLKGELVYRMAETQFLSGKYAEAIKGMAQVLEQYPNFNFTQDALTNMLLAYFNLGQYDGLISEYQKDIKTIKDDDSYFPIHFTAVMAYIELKQFDEANKLLDHMLSFTDIKPKNRAKIFIKKADILIRQQKYKDGLALLDAYTSENTDHADETLFLKAQAYFGMGDFDHAFNFFENVYVNFPDSKFLKAALLGQAHARKQTGRFKEAEGLFSKYYHFVEASDLKSEALYDEIMMSISAQDLDETLSSAQEYLKTFPQGAQYSDVLFILADSYDKKGLFKDAVSLLQGYLASPSPLRPNAANFLLGYNLQLLGNSDEALAAYAKVDGQKEEGKFYSAALKNMAIIYLNQKKDEQASIYFDRLIGLPGDNDLQLKTYIWVCNEYLKLQKYDDVLRIALGAEKKFPSSDLLEIKYFKSEALRGEDKCDDALAGYNSIISSGQKNVYTGSAHIGYGLCLAKGNKINEAKAEFQKALDENADDYTVTVHARFETANLLESQGGLEEALKLYLLIATIYDNDYFCSESLLKGAKIAEKLQRKTEALKMYAEILEKYKNSKAALLAQERVGSLK